MRTLERKKPPIPPPPIPKKGPANKGWCIPKLWNGGQCFILGGGPSLNAVNFDLIIGRRIIGVNNAYGDPIKNNKGETVEYRPRNWVDICWFGDERWYTWHRKYLRGFPGLICCCREEMNGRDGIYGICRGEPEGLDPRPRYVSWNRSSGGSAISFAYHLGVKRIVLLGFDMRRVDDKPNWHNDHPSPDKNPYHRFLKPFPFIAKDAKKLGLEIINSTPDSAITQFPFVPLEEVVNEAVSVA